MTHAALLILGRGTPVSHSPASSLVVCSLLIGLLRRCFITDAFSFGAVSFELLNLIISCTLQRCTITCKLVLRRLAMASPLIRCGRKRRYQLHLYASRHEEEHYHANRSPTPLRPADIKMVSFQHMPRVDHGRFRQSSRSHSSPSAL